MSYADLQTLIGCLIIIDVTIVVFFIVFTKKLKHFNKQAVLEKEIELFESLIADAGKMADQFRSQLEEKHRLIKGLNEKLDRRIISLNVLLNRADIQISSIGNKQSPGSFSPVIPGAQQSEVISLAKEGFGPEEIAKKLLIPPGEVKLMLDLNEKFSKMQDETGAA